MVKLAELCIINMYVIINYSKKYYSCHGNTKVRKIRENREEI